MFAEYKYEEGLELIASTEKYLAEDETIKIYKENFTAKKEEADIIKEQNKYNTGITYDQLARNPEEYEGGVCEVLREGTAGDVLLRKDGVPDWNRGKILL